eukprot:PhM_4_TR9134/c0_g1_i3/m.34619
MSDQRIRKLLLESKQDIRSLREDNNKKVADSLAGASPASNHQVFPSGRPPQQRFGVRGVGSTRLAPLQDSPSPSKPVGPVQPQGTDEISVVQEMHTIRVSQPLHQAETTTTIAPVDTELDGFAGGNVDTLRPRIRWNEQLFVGLPTSRQAAIKLEEYLTTMLEQIHNANSELLDESEPRVQFMRDCQRLYNLVMHELTRQVAAHCAERGHLLAKLWCRSVDVFNELLTVFDQFQCNAKNQISSLERDLRDLREDSLLATRHADNTIRVVKEGARAIIDRHIAHESHLRDEAANMKQESLRSNAKADLCERKMKDAQAALARTQFWESMYHKSAGSVRSLQDELTAVRMTLMQQTRTLDSLRESTGGAKMVSTGMQTDQHAPGVSPAINLDDFTLRTLFVPTPMPRLDVSIGPAEATALPPTYTTALRAVDALLTGTSTIKMPRDASFVQPVGRGSLYVPELLRQHVDLSQYSRYEPMMYKPEWLQFTLGACWTTLSTIKRPRTYLDSFHLHMVNTFGTFMPLRLMDLTSNIKAFMKSSQRAATFALMFGMVALDDDDADTEVSLPGDTVAEVFPVVRALLDAYCRHGAQCPDVVDSVELLRVASDRLTPSARQSLTDALSDFERTGGQLPFDAAVLHFIRVTLLERIDDVEKVLMKFFTDVFEISTTRREDVVWVLTELLHLDVDTHFVEQCFPEAHTKVSSVEFVQLVMRFAVPGVRDIEGVVALLPGFDPKVVREQANAARRRPKLVPLVAAADTPTTTTTDKGGSNAAGELLHESTMWRSLPSDTHMNRVSEIAVHKEDPCTSHPQPMTPVSSPPL